MKIINTDYILSLNPCKDRKENYLKHYRRFSGTLIEFLDLDKISHTDKIWVLTKNYNLLRESQLREFVLICASVVVDNVDIEDLTTYHTLNLLMFESGEDLRTEPAYLAAFWDAYWAAYSYWAADRAVNWAVYWATDRAADWAVRSYRAADWATEEFTQIEILKNIILNEVESEKIN
jgi:hypothetical protein